MTHPETRVIHSVVPSLPDCRPLSPPIYQTSAFAFDDPEAFAFSLGSPEGFAYSRRANPTTRALEDTLAALEGGVAAFATASGMGAINAVLLSLLRPGDHVVAQRCLYGGTFAVFTDLAARFGIEVTYFSDTPVFQDNTKVLYVETIANPMTGVSDLPALAAAAKCAGVTVVVDNSFASPLLCQPLRHGADIVIHSTTKYLAGHSDVIGGAAVFASADLFRSTWTYAGELGAAADPFGSWLTLRGMQTLALRMERHCSNAEYVATRLLTHPAVSAVHWPGLAGHPDHAIAKRLLSGYGGVLAFDLASRAAGRAFTSKVRLAALAASLGGVETLVLHPASTSHQALDAAALRAAGIGEGTVRMAVGLEHPEDIWADVEQALDD
ncbi:methionine gamma-lyase [Lentzea sp. NBRC 105346]|uniref:trans-sulfuration enzyme family protein n=1 Tax=Lentzea sp. NBRC 105346 TaxID=3032205 RepID=UPI0024A4957D|nr:aminotransferase class I/II-fold pyridoxal phosphate-dependent enzyme [Lentzea sp. NBRC 105346]GLZ31233.1 methionine gamma-lyase [Lentzea sp. NBRC 105346]